MWTLIAVIAVFALSTPLAHADVTRFDIVRRERVGTSNYEKIVGSVHFAISPRNPRNRVIADLDKAPLSDSDRVEFSGDLYILQPIDPSQSNGVLLADIPNRGAKLVLQNLSGAPGRNDFVAEGDFGDGLLTRAGFTIAWIGWQFDVPRRPATVSFQAPHAQGVTGVVRASFTPSSSDPTFTVTDLAGYAPIEPAGPDSVLTVRDGPFGRAETIARDRWQLDGQLVSLNGGFAPGRTYELAYRASNPAIAGTGLAGVRDVISWLKHSADAPTHVRYALAYGASQSARFLRAFLYDGFNADERDRQVFDGVFAFGAGATRLSVNERWALPNGNGFFTSAAFPFSDRAQRNPLTGETEGLLDNGRARAHQPKVFYVNTASEYWGLGRSAALIHTSPDGASDIAPPENVRIYFAASTQHLGAQFPPRITTGQQLDNTLGAGLLRPLFIALDRWVREAVPPPLSRYPKREDGTLIPADEVRFPPISAVARPQGIPAGRDRGRVLPLLVPQVDEDGNDVAGIRAPALVAPLATYTGWNFRNESIGASTELVPFLGSFVPFVRTKSDREAVHYSRRSIEERYESKDEYMSLTRKATERLIVDGYALPDELSVRLKRADDLWQLYAAGR